jgi:dienelactone hydrolase
MTDATPIAGRGARPGLITLAPRGAARGVVLLAHGGREHSHRRDSHARPPALRMLPFLADISRAGRRHGLAVAQLRYRVVGFNDGDPVRDVQWALDRLAERFDAPACLIGHSMGARAAVLAAAHPSVVAVAGLATWAPGGDPVAQLSGRTLMLAHGTRDTTTDPARSYALALRARSVASRVCRFEIAGGRHAMLHRARLWQQLARDFALQSLGLAPLEGRLGDAFALAGEASCRVQL